MTKQSLTIAVILVAITIAMLIVAASDDPNAYGCQGDQWQAPDAVVTVGHHDGWRNLRFDRVFMCDEQSDDCYPSAWSDDEDDDCETFAGNESQFQTEPSRRAPAASGTGTGASGQSVVNQPAVHNPGEPVSSTTTLKSHSGQLGILLLLESIGAAPVHS